jgi:hypothetical protein
MDTVLEEKLEESNGKSEQFTRQLVDSYKLVQQMPPRAQLEKDYTKTLADGGIGNRTAFMIERVYAEDA